MWDYDYHTKLSWDAQAWAELTGIAQGWVNGSRLPDTEDYLVGCERCGKVVVWAVTLLEIEAARFDMRAEVERRTVEDFLAETRCPHYYRKFVMAKDNPTFRRAVEWIAAMKALRFQRETGLQTT